MACVVVVVSVYGSRMLGRDDERNDDDEKQDTTRPQAIRRPRPLDAQSREGRRADGGRMGERANEKKKERDCKKKWAVSIYTLANC